MKTSYKLVVVLAVITASCSVNKTSRQGKLESTDQQSNTNLNHNLSDGMLQKETVHIQWETPIERKSNFFSMVQMPVEVLSIVAASAGTNVIVHRDPLRNSSAIIAKSVLIHPIRDPMYSLYHLRGLQTTNGSRFELVVANFDFSMKSSEEFIGFRKAYDFEKKKFPVVTEGRSVSVTFDASYLVSHAEEGLYFRFHGNGGALEVNVLSEYVQGFVSKAKEHGFLPK